MEMLTLPRLPLPGTFNWPSHVGALQAATYSWSPQIITLLDAASDYMSQEESQYGTISSDGTLGKGQRSRLACLRCRMKKTKCDGATPCNQCIKTLQDCSYEERRKPELSERALSEKLALLQQKYESLASASISGTPARSRDSKSSSPVPSVVPEVTESTRQVWNQIVISNELRNILLRIALTYLPRCGFNMDPEPILNGLSLPEHQQPHPSMINALMLVGTYYAHESDPLPPDCPPPEYFVYQVRNAMSNALSDVDRITHFIAASVMLSWWLMQHGRFLEGQYEISSTARLAIDCGLHQTDEKVIRYLLDPSSNPAPAQAGILGLPTNTADLELRINVFWGIYLMDKNCAMMTGLPAAFDAHTSNPSLRITTVWPKYPGTYQGPWNTVDFTSVDDLMGFPQVPTPSAAGLQFRQVNMPKSVTGASAQAMGLLLRGLKLSASPPRTLEEANALRTNLITLNQAISRFTAQLPRDVTLPAIKKRGPPYAFSATVPQLAFFCLAEIRCAAYVVIIKMHQAAQLLEQFEGGIYRLSDGLGMGEEKRMAAARAVLEIATNVFEELSTPDCDLTAKDGLCLISGYLWTNVAVVFIERIAALRKDIASKGTSSAAVTGEIQRCCSDLAKMLDALRRMASVFPVLKLQIDMLDDMMKEVI